MPNQSTNPLTVDSIVGLFKTEAGDLYMDIQVTVGAGTGPSPEPTGVHVYRIPVMAKIS